jgi:hypothetical protein
MRTTPSRFTSFIASVDPNVEGRPASGATTPVTAPAQAAALDSSLSVLERRYPSVIQTLRLLWGYPELNQYFEKVYSGRDSSLNLAPDAMAELMLLASVHQRICPHRPALPVDDIFGIGHRSDVWKPARLRR